MFHAPTPRAQVEPAKSIYPSNSEEFVDANSKENADPECAAFRRAAQRAEPARSVRAGDCARNVPSRTRYDMLPWEADTDYPLLRFPREATLPSTSRHSP